MADLIIKASSNNDLVIQGSDDSPAITIGDTGTTTFAEPATMSGTLGVTGATTLSGATTCSTTLGVTGNTTLSGTANNLGTVTAGTLGSAVVGGQAGTCYFVSAFSSDTYWEAISATNPVPFNSIEVDDDSCCSVTGGTVRFTAPATGVYLFGFSIYTAECDSGNYFSFALNGALLNYMAANDYHALQESDAADRSNNASMAIKLTTSQYVTVIVPTGISDYYAGHSQWWGCRLR